MDILRINNYINIAKADLLDDAEFKHLHDELEQERETLNSLGYDPEKIINILYGIWCQRIGYILDNTKVMDSKIADAIEILLHHIPETLSEIQ